MSRPLVKIIIPCYGYADWLEGCVATALNQPGVEPRVLIIDDCSPDRTPEAAAKIMEHDSRVEYKRHAENLGLVGTINDGLNWADDGDYTVVLSADDLLVPGCLQRAVSVMESSPNVGLVYGRAPYAQVGRPLPATDGNWRGTSRWPGSEWIRLRCRSGYNCISSPEVVVRTSVHRAAGHYDPRCYHTSDMNMWLRIAALADVAYVQGASQAIYRVHPNSMLRSDYDPLVDLRERWIAFDSFFEASRSALAGGERLRLMAGRALARQALWIASRTIDKGSPAAGEDLSALPELVAFAQEVFPEASSLREWRGFQIRRRLGPGRSRFAIPFLVTGAAHRARTHYIRARWLATGV